MTKTVVVFYSAIDLLFFTRKAINKKFTVAF